MQDLLQIILRTVLGYLILLILMKFMGKREIGQLSLFDLLILLTIVDIMVVGIENYQMNYWYCLIPMILMALIQKIVAMISLKRNSFRNCLDGKETIIIENGKIVVENMQKNGYNMDDLYIQLRNKDVISPSEVSYAILETNGKLSVFLKKDYQSLVLPLIVSGELKEEYIIKAGFTKKFIINYCRQKGYLDIHDVYGLNVINGKLEIVEKTNS